MFNPIGFVFILIYFWLICNPILATILAVNTNSGFWSPTWQLFEAGSCIRKRKNKSWSAHLKTVFWMHQFFHLCICSNYAYFSICINDSSFRQDTKQQPWKKNTNKEGKKIYCFTWKKILVQLDVADKFSNF